MTSLIDHDSLPMIIHFDEVILNVRQRQISDELAGRLQHSGTKVYVIKVVWLISEVL